MTGSQAVMAMVALYGGFVLLAIGLIVENRSQATTARIKSSGRIVPIVIEEQHFFVLRPLTYRDRALNTIPVAGPFKLTDERFEIQK